MKEAPQFSNDYRLLSCFFFPKLKIILLVKSVSKAFRLFLSSIVCIYILGFFHNGASLAATFIVTKTSDSADGSCDFDCSLREAIIAANGLVGMDTVVLGIEGTYLISIGGTEENSAASGDLDITDDLNINGLTMASTIIDGGGIDRVLHVDPAATGVEVNISNLTVMNGYAPNELDINNRSGGGIDNRGILNLTNMIVKNNQAIFIGGSGGGSLIQEP